MSPPTLLESPLHRLASRRSSTMTRTIPLIGLVLLGFVSVHYITTKAGSPNMFDSAYVPAWSPSLSIWDEKPSTGRPGEGPSRPRPPPDGFQGEPESDPWYNDIFTFLRPNSNPSSSSSTSSRTTCSWRNLPGALQLDKHDPLGGIWESVIRPEGGGTRGKKCVVELGWMKGLVKSVREEDARIRREALEGRLGDRLGVGKVAIANEGQEDMERRWIPQEDPFPEPETGIDPSSSTIHSLSRLTSKRILLMGDSIERVMFEHLEEIIPRSDNINGTILITSTMDEVPVVVPNVPMPPGGHARSLMFPTTAEEGASWDSAEGGGAMRFDFLHFYGMDDDHLLSAAGEGIPEGSKPGDGIWADKGSHTPGNGPPTLTARFERMSFVWSEDYDVCVIGSGLWDLARFQRTQYITRGVDDSIGLPVDWLINWAEDASHMIQMVRERYSCRIAWRILHDPRSDSGGWFLPPHLPPDVPKTAPFTPSRIHQMRQAQLDLVKREGIEMVPFGLVMQAQGNTWLKDDIHPGPGGSAIYAEMLMEMAAESS